MSITKKLRLEQVTSLLNNLTHAPRVLFFDTNRCERFDLRDQNTFKRL